MKLKMKSEQLEKHKMFHKKLKEENNLKISLKKSKWLKFSNYIKILVNRNFSENLKINSFFHR